jgi:sortase A
MRVALTYLRRALTVVAAVCLGGWTAVKVYAYVSTVHNEATLERLVRERDGSSAPSRLPDWGGTVQRPADGALLGRIDIPRVGVSAVILEGAGERWLEQAAGHLPDTALPGTDGNAAIAGHRDSTFSNLSRIRLGDTVVVTTPAVTRLYRVDSLRLVKPDDTAVLAPTHTARLTLITCYPFHYIGPAPDRFVVQARAVASGAGEVVVPPARPAAPHLADSSLRRRTAVHHTRVAPAHRTAARSGGGLRLPAAKPLPPLPPTSSAKPPKVSWLRRLFHLGPKHAKRR